MSQYVENERLITRYLLGDLSEEEQEKVEDEYFSNDDFFEDVIAAEHNLIDSYLREQLSDHEREQFENRFLTSPARRERVEFARAMAKSFPVPVPPTPLPRPLSLPQAFGAFWNAQTRALRLSFGLAALLLALGVSWLLFESIRLRSLVNEMREEQAALRQDRQELTQQGVEQRTSNERLIKVVEDYREEQLKAQQVQALERTAKQEDQPDWLITELLQARAEQVLLRRRVQQSVRELALLRERNDKLSVSLVRYEDTINSLKSLSPEIVHYFTTRINKPGQAEPVILAVKSVRDNIEPQKIEISRFQDRLLLQINLETDTHKRYQVSIQTTTGEPVLAKGDLKPKTTPDGRVLLIDLPATALTDQKCYLRLEGLKTKNEYEPLGMYIFEIVKK